MGEYDLQSMTNSRMVLDEKAGSETAGKSVPTPASQGNRCEDFSLARYRYLTLPSPTSDSSSIVGTLGEIAVAVVWSVRLYGSVGKTGYGGRRASKDSAEFGTVQPSKISINIDLCWFY